MQLKRFTLDNFVSGYQQHYQRLSTEKIPRGLLKYEKSMTLFTLIEMLFSAVQEESPEAAALLTLLAFLGPWRFPLAIFRVSAAEEHRHTAALADDRLRAVLMNNTALSLAVSHLRDACLVKTFGDSTSPESVSVHNIICQWIFETTADKESWVPAAAATVTAGIRRSQER